MTHQKIDTQVLADDLERLFSGVLLADPQEILSSNPADLNDIMMDMIGVGDVTVSSFRVTSPCYSSKCYILIVSCVFSLLIPIFMRDQRFENGSQY